MNKNGNHLRKRIRKMMIDLDFKYGAIKDLAGLLGFNQQALTMALTGYRKNPRSIQMLKELQAHLTKLKQART